MTFTLTQLWQIFLAMCGSLITIAGAGAIIIGLINKAKKPDAERDGKLKRHDELLDNDNKRLKALEEHQTEIEESQKMMMRAMVALMRHAIDGNNIEQLTKESNKLNEYIFNK